jgi:hypothetical protein
LSQDIERLAIFQLKFMMGGLSERVVGENVQVRSCVDLIKTPRVAEAPYKVYKFQCQCRGRE